MRHVVQRGACLGRTPGARIAPGGETSGAAGHGARTAPSSTDGSRKRGEAALHRTTRSTCAAGTFLFTAAGAPGTAGTSILGSAHRGADAFGGASRDAGRSAGPPRVAATVFASAGAACPRPAAPSPASARAGVARASTVARARSTRSSAEPPAFTVRSSAEAPWPDLDRVGHGGRGGALLLATEFVPR